MSPRRTVASAAPALSATVGWEATIAKCGDARSARSCVLYAARSSGLRRTSRTSARPHRRSPCRRSGRAGLCRRCGSGCGGAGCKGGGGVVAASRRDAHRSRTASSLPRRRCRTSWLRRPLAAAEPLRWPLGWRPSDGVAVRSESRITNVAPSRRPRCRGERAGAAREGGGSEPEPSATANILSPGWRGALRDKFGGVEGTKVGDNSH